MDLLLAYYGDDFTGSTDVLESLAISGIPTVLFLEPPSDEMLRRFPHVRAIGVAGNSRTMSPAEMESSLPRQFRALGERRPKIVHYKVCSTFDSSPVVGSIGCAIDIGHRIFQNRFVPVLAAAPGLRRFCVFGNLFASSGLDSEIYRLDRHPTMREHPTTPIREADLRLHLGRQSERPIELVDVLALEQGNDAASDRLAYATRESGSIVLFDALTDGHLATIGQLLCKVQKQEQKPLFMVGSSGVEYALGKHWQSTAVAERSETASPVEQTLVVSGSCSPVTDRQIAWAIEQGFQEVALDTTKLCQSNGPAIEIAEVAREVTARLNTGRSVIVHTGRGPNDPRIVATRRVLGVGMSSAKVLGKALGRMLREVVGSCAVKRVVVVGGDTSGFAAQTLGIDALEFFGPLEPGAPLCTAHSHDDAIDGLQIVFKGGQVGYDSFFNSVLLGQPSRCLVGANR